MELTKKHEAIAINEIIFNGVLEQSVELDYLLPDYSGSIFKVLKCRIVPKITSERVENGRLTIDGVAVIKVIYVCEENYKIRSICQKQVFSKTTELKENLNSSSVTSFIKCDYVNCRVVNPKRLDIRGAISIKATVCGSRELNLLSGAEGSGIQLRGRRMRMLDRRLRAVKDFTVKEDLEIGYGKPAANEIIDYRANAVVTECKIIQNKIIAKGEIMLHILYCDENDCPEIMEYTLPISQIIDLAGVDEDFCCNLHFEVCFVQFNIKNEENCIIEAEITLRAICEALRNVEANLVGDVFSTKFKVSADTADFKLEELVSSVSEASVLKCVVGLPNENINRVFDVSCEFGNENVRIENGEIMLSGNLESTVLAEDNDSMPVLLEKSVPCDIKLNAQAESGNIFFSPFVTVTAVSYTVVNPNELEIKAEVKLDGNLTKYEFVNTINDISLDENEKKVPADDAVLRLYFASEGEEVWDIAKRFNTSPDVIIEENSLEGDRLQKNGMLLIPIIL